MSGTTAGVSTGQANARVAWLFLAPALALIAVFFFIPVAAALLLSFTDFDIYALADLNNVRFIGLQNYERLFANAADFTFLFVGNVDPASLRPLVPQILQYAKALRSEALEMISSALIGAGSAWGSSSSQIGRRILRGSAG